MLERKGDYVPPTSCEVTQVTSSSCELTLLFPATAPLSELTGVIVTNEEVNDVGDRWGSDE